MIAVIVLCILVFPVSGLMSLPFPVLAGSVGAANLLDRVWCGSILARCASLDFLLFLGASHDDHPSVLLEGDLLE